MTAVNTNELLAYYQTHSDNNTRKHFHIKRSRLYKILSEAGAAPHSAEENHEFKLAIMKENLTDEKRRSKSEKLSAANAKFWADKTYSFPDAELIAYFEKHTIYATAKHFNIHSYDVCFILKRNNVPNHTKEEVSAIKAKNAEKIRIKLLER